MRKIYLLFGWLLSVTAFGQTAEVRGFLTDAASGEPIIYTNVLLKGTSYGVATDLNGYFSITKVPPGSYVLSVRSLGYDSLSIPITLTANQILTRNLSLRETTQQLQEVEVRGNRIDRERLVAASVTTIAPREIQNLPSVGGEPDVAQYLQTIPGVVSTGDQGGQIYIRGGAPVQTLFLLDGMVLYNPFHSIGLFSVFDTEILKSVEVYTGGFGAEFGGRTSAIMDVRTRDGNKKRLGGTASVNPFTAKLALEGPLVKNPNGGGISFLLSGRTSYLDRTADIFYPYAVEDSEVGLGQNLPFSFNDFYGKVTVAGAQGSKVSAFGFSFNDQADLGFPFSFAWDALGGGVNFVFVPEGASVLINGTFAYSNYDIGITETTAAARQSEISGFNGGLDFTYFFNQDELKYGAGIIGNRTSFTSPATLNADGQGQGARFDLSANNTELYGFVKYRITRERFVLEPSFRLHYYSSLSQAAPEPRLGAKLIVSPSVRLKGAAGLYSQNLISTQSDRDVVNLFSGFISSPNNLRDASGDNLDDKLQRSRHLVLGVEYDLNEDLTLNLEPYVKDFPQIVNVNRNRVPPNNDEFVVEEGVARGIDLSANYERGSLLLRATYSLAEITREWQTNVALADATPNVTTVEYNPNFDRRHNINLLGAYLFGAQNRWEINARFNFGTGFPFTQTRGFYEQVLFPEGIGSDLVTENGSLGIFYGDANDLNRGQLPAYHRLDVSVKRRFDLGPQSELTLTAGATNVYNRDNLFYFDRVNFQRVNQLPILPSVGANWSF